MVAKDCQSLQRAKRAIEELQGEPASVPPVSIVECEEPCNKRVRSLTKTSLANLISPVKHLSRSFQRASLGKSEAKGPGYVPRRTLTKTTSASKRRNSKLWSETFEAGANEVRSSMEIKRQEAIFELCQGEADLVEDMQLAKNVYHDPMLKLNILTEAELTQIFGALDSFIPLHEELLGHLSQERDHNGAVEQVAQILLDWLPCLNAYTGYCSNQVFAKALLDHKKQNPRVRDFLQRCRESPFSRKLDLWSFLDVPRSRLVKYPLLIREILRHTPPEHSDHAGLLQAIDIIEGIMNDMNVKAGESECRFYVDQLEYADSKYHSHLINTSRILYCHGELRNQRGTKVHVFLFDKVLVLTRSILRGEHQCFQVYHPPIPTSQLLLQDFAESRASLRGPFGSDRGKNIFRVGRRGTKHARLYTLQSDSAYSKQRWLSCLQTAISAHPGTSQGSQPPNKPVPNEEDLDESLSTGPPSDSEDDRASTMDFTEERNSGSDSESDICSVMDTSEHRLSFITELEGTGTSQEQEGLQDHVVMEEISQSCSFIDIKASQSR
uniref:Neuroepithelial cell transforming 1 n=1 Tax=Eptatretus burgeri TaxID=7764 RepID=A0A8C4QQM1_EPTBU